MSLLEARGITKRFAGICALDNVDLDVAEAEIHGLIGPNGAGKTTLFNCICGLTPPDEGVVRFDGRDVTNRSVQHRARLGIGRTFQRLELFGGLTVRDHLLVTERVRHGRGGLWRDLVGRSRPTAAEQERVGATLDLLGLTADADRPIEALPLGRCRLVELARALMTEPKLLFLDEPSSGLDTRETAEVADVLRALPESRGIAVLLVEHDLPTVRALADRLTVLDLGTVLAHGPTAEVLADDRVRDAYLGAST